jgi:F-type H+-transporting ATPase subunit delta
MSAVAGRYAKALFALAKESSALQPTADQLARAAAVAGDPGVEPLLRSPLLSAARRRDVAEMLIGELQLPDLLARFVRVLADHQRLAALPVIAGRFRDLLDHELGRVRITIQSARALDAQQEKDVIATFAKLTNKQVIPTVAVNPDLLGGVIVEAEGKVYDGSVRTHLDRLAKELAGTVSH